MSKELKTSEIALGLPEGARSATGGEPADTLSREVAVPIYKLEQWRDRALTGITSELKERENDPLEKALGEAPFGRQEIVAISRGSTVVIGKHYSLERIGQILEFPRSTIGAQQASAKPKTLFPQRCGTKPKISDIGFGGHPCRFGRLTLHWRGHHGVWARPSGFPSAN